MAASGARPRKCRFVVLSPWEDGTKCAERMKIEKKSKLVWEENLTPNPANPSGRPLRPALSRLCHKQGTLKQGARHAICIQGRRCSPGDPARLSARDANRVLAAPVNCGGHSGHGAPDGPTFALKTIRRPRRRRRSGANTTHQSPHFLMCILLGSLTSSSRARTSPSTLADLLSCHRDHRRLPLARWLSTFPTRAGKRCAPHLLLRMKHRVRSP